MRRLRQAFERWRRYRRVSGQGGAEVFVYGECICGWAMLGTEGARWPKCPECKRQVMPPPPGALPKGRLEAAVILVETTEAVDEVRRIGGGRLDHQARLYGERRFDPDDVARWLDGYGFGATGYEGPPHYRNRETAEQMAGDRARAHTSMSGGW